MSESRNREPVLLQALRNAEQQGGYSGHISLNADVVVDPISPPIVSRPLGSREAKSTPKMTTPPITPSSSSPSDVTPVKGVTSLNLVRKPLRGNGTGVLMGTSSSSASKRRLDSDVLYNHDTPKRPLSSTRASLFCPSPITSRLNGDRHNVPQVAIEPLNLSSEEEIQLEKIEDPVENASCIKFAVCEHCGTTSRCFETCDSCRRQLATPKEYVPQKSKDNSMKVFDKRKSSSSTLPTCSIASLGVDFFGKNVTSVKSSCAIKPILKKTPLSLRVQRFTSRSKQIKKLEKVEPPVLTLSSDDDEKDAENTENTNEKNCLPGENVTEDAGSTTAVAGTDTEEFLANQDISSTNSSPSVSTSNESSTTSVSDTISLHCRLRIGSYKVTPKDPIIISETCFLLEVPTVIKDDVIMTVRIYPEDINTVLTHFGHDVPCLFFDLKPSCAANIRSRLWMTDKSGPYYDPSTDDDCLKRFIMLPNNIDENHRRILNRIFTSIAAGRNTGAKNVFHEVITKTAVNKLLLLSSQLGGLDNFDCLKKRNTAIIQSQKPRPSIIRHSLRLQKQRSECVTLATYPPPPEVCGIAITSDDIRCLASGEFLNDVIIDFYLKYLFYEKLSESDRNRTHIFSSFFYKRLTNSDMPSENGIGKDVSNKSTGNRSLKIAEGRHSRVKKWTRNVNIFSKDFIIIPINDNSHWFLAIICFAHLVGLVGDEESCPPPSADHDYESESLEDTLFGDEIEKVKSKSRSISPAVGSSRDESSSSKRPCILIFDSLRGHSCWSHVFHQLREYLAIEFQHKMHSKREFSKETIRASYPIVPQQTNYSDCGIFVLQYAESFFKDPIKNFETPIRGVDTWFSSEVISGTKRKEIEDIILRLQKEQQVDNV